MSACKFVPASQAVSCSAEHGRNSLARVLLLFLGLRYGFQTSTRINFLAMVTMSDMIVKDLDVITVSLVTEGDESAVQDAARHAASGTD